MKLWSNRLTLLTKTACSCESWSGSDWQASRIQFCDFNWGGQNLPHGCRCSSSLLSKIVRRRSLMGEKEEEKGYYIYMPWLLYDKENGMHDHVKRWIKWKLREGQTGPIEFWVVGEKPLWKKAQSGGLPIPHLSMLSIKMLPPLS